MATDLTSIPVVAGDEILATDINGIRSDLVRRAGDFETSGGAGGAYTLSIDASISAYAAGQVFCFSAKFTSVGSDTLNVNGLGASAIHKDHDVVLEAGDIESGQNVMVMYDGTHMQMLSQKAIDIASSSKATLVGGGSADSLHGHLFHSQHRYSFNMFFTNTQSPRFCVTPSLGYMFLANAAAGSGVNILQFVRDTVTGLYYYNNVTVSMSGEDSNATYFGIYATDSYVYVGAKKNGANDIIFKRFTLALAEETTLAVTGADFAVSTMGQRLSICGNDSTLYVLGDDGGTDRLVPYAINNALATLTRGANVALGINPDDITAAHFDGTDILLMDRNTNSSVKRISVAAAATLATGPGGFMFARASVNTFGSSGTNLRGVYCGLSNAISGALSIFSIHERYEDQSGTKEWELHIDSLKAPVA